MRPIGSQQVGVGFIFSSFTLSICLCSFVASPRRGLLATAIVLLVASFVAALRWRYTYAATVLLHEEVRNMLLEERPLAKIASVGVDEIV